MLLCTRHDQPHSLTAGRVWHPLVSMPSSLDLWPASLLPLGPCLRSQCQARFPGWGLGVPGRHTSSSPTLRFRMLRSPLLLAASTEVLPLSAPMPSWPGRLWGSAGSSASRAGMWPPGLGRSCSMGAAKWPGEACRWKGVSVVNQEQQLRDIFAADGLSKSDDVGQCPSMCFV